MSALGTRKFIPFKVSEPLHDDTDECWTCGAPHMEWVNRKRGNPQNWILASGRGIRKPGYHESGRVVVDPETGNCYACRIAKEAGMIP